MVDANFPEYKKFVLAGTRKSYACETKELAAESFMARKRKYVRILKARLKDAETVLDAAGERLSRGEPLEFSGFRFLFPICICSGTRNSLWDCDNDTSL